MKAQRQTAPWLLPMVRAKAATVMPSLLRYRPSAEGVRSIPARICQVADKVKKGSAPHGPGPGERAPVPKKTAEDLEAEARIRAHLRHQMAERRITATELARRIKADDGNITRILGGTRGVKSLGQVLRICRGLGLTATRLLEEDAPPQYRDDAQPADDNNKAARRGRKK